MLHRRSRFWINIVSLISIVIFVIVCSFTIVWANGLRYNTKTHLFEYTALISIDDHLKNVTITLNGETVGTEAPLTLRNLKAGYYKVDITRNGFYTYEKKFQLSTNGVNVIEGVNLIAMSPNITVLDPSQAPKYISSPEIDTGLDIADGELNDYGQLITRFTTIPSQIHRYNSGYLYQTGQEIRLFLPNGNLDVLIYKLQDAGQAHLTLKPSSWIIYCYEGSQIKQIELTKTSAVSAASQ